MRNSTKTVRIFTYILLIAVLIWRFSSGDNEWTTLNYIVIGLLVLLSIAELLVYRCPSCRKYSWRFGKEKKCRSCGREFDD